MCQQTIEIFPCSTPGCERTTKVDRRTLGALCTKAINYGKEKMRWGICLKIQTTQVSVSDADSYCKECMAKKKEQDRRDQEDCEADGAESRAGPDDEGQGR